MKVEKKKSFHMSPKINPNIKNTNPKIIFFEWGESEEFVVNKFDLQLPKPHQKQKEAFNLDQALGFEIISIRFLSQISNSDLDKLKDSGCQKICLRIAGFNMLDTNYAHSIGLKVYRVAEYSVESIAEFTISLILNLARKMNQNWENFHSAKSQRSLDQLGFSLKGKTLGLHGYGKIGRATAKIARDGFGMEISYFDPYFEGESPDQKFDNIYDFYTHNQIISLHMPLCQATKNVINTDLLEKVQPNFMLINTSRGGLIETSALQKSLSAGQISYLGLDVWENDDLIQKELYQPNILQTYHLAFFTQEAVKSMLEQTIESINGSPRMENILPIN